MTERKSNTLRKAAGSYSNFVIENPAKVVVGITDTACMAKIISTGRPEAIAIGAAITGLTLGAATIFDRRRNRKMKAT
jgi:hypothetical protein